MKKVQKFLLGIVVVLFVLIIAVAVMIKMYGNQALKAGIEKGSQKALKVDTRLGAISLKIFGGELDMNNFEIDNPEGYEHDTFLKLGHGYVSLDTGSLLDDTIVIKQITLEDIEVVLEQKLGTSNLKDIINNLPKSEPEETEPAEEKTEGGKNVLVNELVIRNVTVKANLLPVPGMAKATTVTIPLDEIRMENIGSKEKVDVAALTGKILKAITAGILKKGGDALPIDMIGDIGKQLGEFGGEALKQVQGVGEGIIKGGEDIGKSATDAVKGLLDFGKKKEE